MVGVTAGNEKIYDVAWGYKRVGTIVGTDVGTVVGTRYVFWCFRAFFTNVYEQKIQKESADIQRIIVKYRLIWRSKRDLNSRGGFPPYALSRGASSTS